MKNIKKQLFNKILVFSVVLGVAFSFNTQSADANVLIIDDGGGQIPCWSYGSDPLISFRKYVECSTCARVKGKPLGGQGECTGG